MFHNWCSWFQVNVDNSITFPTKCFPLGILGAPPQHVIATHMIFTQDTEVRTGNMVASAGATGWVKLVPAGCLPPCRFTILGSHQTILVEQSVLFEHFQFCKATMWQKIPPRGIYKTWRARIKREKPHPSSMLQRKKDGLALRRNLMFYPLQQRQSCRWVKMGNLKGLISYFFRQILFLPPWTCHLFGSERSMVLDWKLWSATR